MKKYVNGRVGELWGFKDIYPSLPGSAKALSCCSDRLLPSASSWPSRTLNLWSCEPKMNCTFYRLLWLWCHITAIAKSLIDMPLPRLIFHCPGNNHNTNIPVSLEENPWDLGSLWAVRSRARISRSISDFPLGKNINVCLFMYVCMYVCMYITLNLWNFDFQKVNNRKRRGKVYSIKHLR